MALLQKIKKKLGFGGGASDSDGGETAVTVEREPDEADESVSTESDAGAVEPDESPVETDAGTRRAETRAAVSTMPKRSTTVTPRRPTPMRPARTTTRPKRTTTPKRPT